MGSRKSNEHYNGKTDILIKLETDIDSAGFIKEVESKLNLYPVTYNNLTQIGDLVITDIKYGIDSGIDLYGKGFIPNTPKWIARKGNDTVYVGKTKQLYNSFKKVVSIFANESNRIGGAYIDITARSGGLYWQHNPKNPKYKRDFFGFSVRINEKIDNFLRRIYG